MKLFYMPGACSLAVHIALREAELDFGLVEVDYVTRRTEAGCDFHAINPKRTVPAILLDNGEVLTEVPVMLQFVDGMSGGTGLLPNSGLPRLRALEWLTFIATEIHKSFNPLFRPTTPDDFLLPGRVHLRSRLSVVERHLSRNTYLLGEDVSVADFYLFTVSRWLADQDMRLVDWPGLQRHHKRIRHRSSVRTALDREGGLDGASE